MPRLPDPPSEPIDLRSDFHGRVCDFAQDQDRLYFENTPGATIRHRPALPHEFCRPDRVPACVWMWPAPQLPAGVEAQLMVEVRLIGPGVRTRQPYYILRGAAA